MLILYLFSDFVQVCQKKCVFACPLLKLLKTDLLEQNWILFGFFQLSNSIYCQFILCWKLTRSFDALNSPGGARPQQGGEGRQLSTARSSFPLKLQPCTATRPSSAIPWQPVCKPCKTLQAGPASGPGSDGYPLPYPTRTFFLLPVPYPEIFQKFQGSG